MVLSLSIEVDCLVLNTLKLDTRWRLVGSVCLCHILPYHFNSLATKYFMYNETLSKTSSLFWTSYSTQTFDKVKFTALSQTWVYPCLSISDMFELLETTWINTWLLLFATELRHHYWHRSRDKPCSVFSYVPHALPVLWLTPEAPASSGLLCVLLELLSCTLKYTAGAPSLIHLPNFVNAPQKLTYMLFLPQKTTIICIFFSKNKYNLHWEDIYMISHWVQCPRPSQVLSLRSHHNFANSADCHYLCLIFLL